jgi:hypothetical protein
VVVWGERNGDVWEGESESETRKNRGLEGMFLEGDEIPMQITESIAFVKTHTENEYWIPMGGWSWTPRVLVI